MKDPFNSKYQFLVNGREKLGIKILKNPKPFIGYLQTVDDIYGNVEGYNPTKKSTDSVWLYDSRYGS